MQQATVHRTQNRTAATKVNSQTGIGTHRSVGSRTTNRMVPKTRRKVDEVKHRKLLSGSTILYDRTQQQSIVVLCIHKQILGC